LPRPVPPFGCRDYLLATVLAATSGLATTDARKSRFRSLFASDPEEGFPRRIGADAWSTSRKQRNTKY
jgi:hypothetical protein